VKPDYLEQMDLDCLIIGGYNGTGRHGGKVSEYLLALADALPNQNPTRWVSFCRYLGF
jgi:DNA ligase-4